MASIASGTQMQRQNELRKLAFCSIVFVLAIGNILQLKKAAVLSQGDAIEAGHVLGDQPHTSDRWRVTQEEALRDGDAMEDHVVRAKSSAIASESNASEVGSAGPSNRPTTATSNSKQPKPSSASSSSPPLPPSPAEPLTNKTQSIVQKQVSRKRVSFPNSAARRPRKPQQQQQQQQDNSQPVKLQKLGRHFNVTLKLPTPILVASLPKSGTTTAWRYFLCGGQTAAHQFAIYDNGNTDQIGKCMMQNDKTNRPMLEGCGNYSVWTDPGYASHSANAPVCYYPSVQSLPKYYSDYPNATIVMFKRNTTAWANSAVKWSRGTMAMRWERCKMTPGRSIDDLVNFYEWHLDHVRQFALDHPSLTYVEVSIDDPMAGLYLEERTGISASCFGNCKPSYKNKCDVTGIVVDTNQTLKEGMVEEA